MNTIEPQRTPPADNPAATPQQPQQPQQPPQERSGSSWSPTALIAVVGLIAVVIIVLLMFGLGGGFNPGATNGGDVNVTQEAPVAPAPEPEAPAPEDGSLIINLTPPADDAQPETQG